jgi:hypothetical protein
MKNSILSCLLLISLFSCIDSKYSYESQEGSKKKVFTFEKKFDLKKSILDSLIKTSILESKNKVIDKETFEILKLDISIDSTKDTTILSFDGYKNLKNPQIIRVSTKFSFKNDYLQNIEHTDEYVYFLQDELIYGNTISIIFNKNEFISDNEYSYKNLRYQSKHYIDSVYTIQWGVNKISVLTTDGHSYDPGERCLNISKNFVAQAIKLLETKNENFIFDGYKDNSFKLNCGMIGMTQLGDYSYNDTYLYVSAKDKSELISKLKFILNYVYDKPHKCTKWVVNIKKGNLKEVYTK